MEMVLVIAGILAAITYFAGMIASFIRNDEILLWLTVPAAIIVLITSVIIGGLICLIF